MMPLLHDQFTPHGAGDLLALLLIRRCLVPGLAAASRHLQCWQHEIARMRTGAGRDRHVEPTGGTRWRRASHQTRTNWWHRCDGDGAAD